MIGFPRYTDKTTTCSEIAISLTDKGNEEVTLRIFRDGDEKIREAFVSIYDDSDTKVTFTSDQIDDLIEALSELKGKL